MRVDSSTETVKSRRALYAGLAVAAIFVLALFLRAYWNVDVAHDGNSFSLSAGSDPYYHKRAIDYIQDNDWKTLISDPMLNYPYGAVNPNPPLFEWSVAVGGALMAPFFSAQGDMSAQEVATWWVMEWSPAIWGALTVIPVYFIGAALFSRRAGVIAAFFMAVSTTALEHTSLGASDHDAMYLFFATLAFLFYIRAVQIFRGDGNWIANYRNGEDVSSGLGRLLRERAAGFYFAVLAGVSTAAVALIWKGFPYLLGVMFAYAAIQLAVDHWRNKDSLGVFLATMITMLLGVVLAIPYYSAASVLSFLNPSWYIIAAFFLFGLVMVPTRDLPTILVMPVFAIVAALLALIAFFVVPDVARSLLYATVYFKQSTLYQTIAEAHPADFNTMAFAIGPIAFFLALAGVVMLFVTASKNPRRATLFAVVWAVLAIYMAQSAVRFLFNATPILAVLAGWVTALIIDWLDFPSIRKNMQASRGGGLWAGIRRSVGSMHVIGALLIALLLVFPNVFLAVDAALPPTAEQKIVDENDGFFSEFVDKRFRAFGQDFLPDYWQDGLDGWLAMQDNDQAPENRPAFLSWWDYGHWAIQAGKHPAVADNFQNGYVYAANFLLSENETHAVQLLSARYAKYFELGRPDASGKALTKADYLRLLEEVGVASNKTEETFATLDKFDMSPNLNLTQANSLVSKVEATTGKSIRYFATDFRMMPFDDPNTGNIDFSSIFYAPVVLADKKEQDEYLEVRVQTNTFDQTGLSVEEWEKQIRNPYRQAPTPLAEFYIYKQPFFNTMFYKGYIGSPVAASGGQVKGDAVLQAASVPQPGYDLKHFRLAYANEQLRILEYVPGAKITGTILEAGEGRAGASVTAYDDAGNILYELLKDRLRADVAASELNIPHDRDFTDTDGNFQLTVPYGMVTLVATDGGVEIGRQTVNVTKAQANAGESLPAVTLNVQLGSVTGRAFHDSDGNGEYNATVDELVGGLQIEVGGKNATTASDGTYTVTGLSPGRRTVRMESTEYQLSGAAASVGVEPGEEVSHNLTLALKQVEMKGVAFADKNANGALDAGEGLDTFRLPFAPAANVTGNSAKAPATPIRTDSGGNYTAQLTPGSYALDATYVDPADNSTYAIKETIEIPRGGASLASRNIIFARVQS